MNYAFQPERGKRRNRYVGSWEETGWQDIPLPFTRDNLAVVLGWGAGGQPSMHSHQDIARWCDQFHMTWVAGKLGDDSEVFEPLVAIANDVSAQWDLNLANTYTLEQLQALQFSSVTLPIEWFQDWVRKLSRLTS